MKLVLLVPLLFFSFAQAAQRTKKTPALCEYELNPANSRALLDIFRDEIFGKPYLLDRVTSGTKAKALQKLGLQERGFQNRLSYVLAHVSLQPQAIDPIAVKLHSFVSGQLDPIVTSSFPDPAPIVWQDVNLSDEELRSSQDQVIQLHPIESIELTDPLVAEGFVSDADSDGVRRFVSFNGPYKMTVGIDAPCDQIKTYAKFAHHSDLLLTRVTSFCRFPILLFTRNRTPKR